MKLNKNAKHTYATYHTNIRSPMKCHRIVVHSINLEIEIIKAVTWLIGQKRRNGISSNETESHKHHFGGET